MMNIRKGILLAGAVFVFGYGYILFQHPVTLFFVTLILVLTLWDLRSFFDAQGKHHRPFRNEIVTLGILGTFTGIFIGLLGFDVDKLTTSIPALLEGMKIAFITSIAGMGCSVLLAIVQKIRPSPYAKSGHPLTDKLAEQSRLLAEFLQDSKKTNAAVIEQVKNHRTESRDELARVRGSLEQTLEKLSEGASREIIKALEDVIADFNQNLTAQFGENFKQLNAACLQLVTWQENYMDAIKASESALSETKASLKDTAESVAGIAKRNKEFEEFCNNTALSLNTMNTMLKNNEEIQDAIKQSIDSLTSLAADLEKIPDDFKAVSTKMNENHARATDYLNETNRKIDTYISESQKAVNKLNTDMKTATDNLNNSLVSLSKQFGDNYQTFLKQIERLMPGAQR